MVRITLDVDYKELRNGTGLRARYTHETNTYVYLPMYTYTQKFTYTYLL